jgi:hypothetical protein
MASQTFKTKNRDYWRWEMEPEGALNRPRVRQFVWSRRPLKLGEDPVAYLAERVDVRTKLVGVLPIE